MRIYCLDNRNRWWRSLAAECSARPGWRLSHRRYRPGSPPGYAFVRPTSVPMEKPEQVRTARQMVEDGQVMITDLPQIETYDDKVLQVELLREWLPPTRVYYDRDAALSAELPLVSKAREGSSSKNVRIIRTQDELRKHVEQAWSLQGIPVDCSPGHTVQQGYLYAQEFIPHNTTWRINRVGDAWAVFKRYNSRETGLCQTGNVEPCADPPEPLMEYALDITTRLDSKWIALDILAYNDAWALLETSPAWPWPSPGECDDAPFLGVSGYRWRDMWRLLLDQIEAGAWDNNRGT